MHPDTVTIASTVRTSAFTRNRQRRRPLPVSPEPSPFQSASFSSMAESDSSPSPRNSDAAAQRAKKATRPRKAEVRELSREAKEEISNLCVKFSALDLRSYNVVKGDGFRYLAQGLIDVGADLGKVDVNTLLPHPSTVSKKTTAVAQRVRDTFLPEVKAAVKEGACDFDTDMWSDKHTKTSYITVEVQYCTPEFELKSQSLFTSQFPPKEKKSGHNIRQ